MNRDPQALERIFSRCRDQAQFLAAFEDAEKRLGTQPYTHGVGRKAPERLVLGDLGVSPAWVGALRQRIDSAGKVSYDTGRNSYRVQVARPIVEAAADTLEAEQIKQRSEAKAAARKARGQAALDELHKGQGQKNLPEQRQGQ